MVVIWLNISGLANIQLILDSANYGSIMRDLEERIRFRIMCNQHMSMSEINLSCLNTPERSVYRAVKRLVELGEIKKKRIVGEGKRERYTMVEEKSTSDITVRAIPEKAYKTFTKLTNADEIIESFERYPVTQTNLSKMINQQIRSYKNELKRIKQFGENEEYYMYHISIIGSSLEWVMKLTMAINSGMFEDSTKKRNLARQNRTQYEEFLTMTCKNIKNYNEEFGKHLIKQIYAELDRLWIMENLKINN